MAWPKIHPVFVALGMRYPLVQAPMAGGPGTPELVAAAASAGCLGFLGAAYMDAAAIRSAAASIRQRTSGPWGINLFLPETHPTTPEAIARMNGLLDRYRQELGLPLSPVVDKVAEDFAAQIAAVMDLRPAVISFTMGCPSAELVARCQAAGMLVFGTATCSREALALEAAGVDGIVAQGVEAGGHRGTFPDLDVDSLVGTMALVPQVVDRVTVPVLAAGGIMDGRGIVAALALGAAGVQMGTAFMTTAEAGTPPVHREAILAASDESTALTREFTGRTARGIRNRFIREMAAHRADLLPFPLQGAMTSDIRAAAKAKADGDLMSLWAGQAAGMAHRLTVAELVTRLDQEVEACLARLTFLASS